MIVDDVTISVKAGDGGNGSVAFNKTKMSLGPTGAKGGRGGSVYIEGVSDLSALNKFRFRKVVKAEKGEHGRSQFHDGSDGEDLILTVPVGTIAYNLTKGNSVEITKIGQRELVASGGKGGRGNFSFRASTNTTPKEFEYGRRGELFEIRFELKMIADVGFVGLPNVGKSSLLNEVTRAKSKVANYPFTTLEPNLGVYYDLILADIPGIIEGAAQGKGLGIKFLRHIERTKTIFHFVAVDSIDPVQDYKTVRNELGEYNKELLEKPEYVFVSKKDTVSEDVVEKAIEKLKKLNKQVCFCGSIPDDGTSWYSAVKNKTVIPISILDPASIDLVKKILNDLISQKTEEKKK